MAYAYAWEAKPIVDTCSPMQPPRRPVDAQTSHKKARSGLPGSEQSSPLPSAKLATLSAGVSFES